MKRYKKTLLFLARYGLILTALDVFLTLIGVELGLAEGNPIFLLLVERIGIALTAGIYFYIVFLATIWFVVLSKHSPFTRGIAIGFLAYRNIGLLYTCTLWTIFIQHQLGWFI